MDDKRNVQEFTRAPSAVPHPWTWIGSGSMGGKAGGLVAINDVFDGEFTPWNIDVRIPAFTVIRTDVFDAFLDRNNLREVAFADSPDDVIAQAFQRASLPAEILGDLRSLVEKLHSPMAVRSSSLLEDALNEPFAGVYTTKMIPNNQPEADVRFQKLMEAIKLVYASVFFTSARDYIRATGRNPRDEKMAIVVQEVIGSRCGDRFYPAVSGVARSYNYYPMGRARREDGVVSLALGLGKTIVDGGKCWTYSPASPKVPPPYGSPAEFLEQTQSEFWSVNMGKPPAYDPINETEYLIRSSLSNAESDGTLGSLVSTYDVQAQRLLMGMSLKGPRVLTFAGLLVLNEIPLNDILRKLLALCEKAAGCPVEIEFAVNLNPFRFGFLQVRPMVVSHEEVHVDAGDIKGGSVLVASECALGNGIIETIRDVVYVKPDRFEARFTQRIAGELEVINRKLLNEGCPYLLIGFGRWGSSDPWLGIPVNWGQVSGAKVIVEATRPAMNVEFSQGSHFFHNLLSFRVSYFSVPHEDDAVNWGWLSTQTSDWETEFVRHVRLKSPLQVMVDGRSGRGVIRTAPVD